MVDEFKAASNERIKEYEAEIARIKARVPYGKMTMEEFCMLVPEKAPFIPCQSRATFWPFDEAEQKVGPVEQAEQHGKFCFKKLHTFWYFEINFLGGDHSASNEGEKMAEVKSSEVQTKPKAATEPKTKEPENSPENKGK